MALNLRARPFFLWERRLMGRRERRELRERLSGDRLVLEQAILRARVIRARNRT
jgi:hypothetical protein